MTTLLQKLHEVANEIQGVQKTGHNKNHDYDYVEAENVTRLIREKLLARDVLVIPGCDTVEIHPPVGGGKQSLTVVKLAYCFVDVKNPEDTIEFQWAGTGADTGDKGLYKAFTGGLKYALLSLFLIPMGDDPEKEETTSKRDDKHPDDERPAAPQIPVDRAVSLLRKAEAAKLATVTWTSDDAPSGVKIKAVLKAKLASVGVTTGKLADLNVDQAEDVEKWIEKEAGKDA